MARLARGKGRTIRGTQIHSSAASMTAVPAQAPQIRAVQWWLVSIAALIALMVLVGGATRLTEAGLSIVEWKPVAGALPPLDQQQWTQAFEAYKKIPQYREMNAGMNLAAFKTIFWWEFSHRLLGRVIGIAYLLPFLWFMWRGFLAADLKRRLWLIFGLGALQGAKAEDQPQPAFQVRSQKAAPHEPQERQQVSDPDHAPEQPVAEFPPEDRLERGEIHAGVHFAILRDLLVGLERLRPLLLVQRRQRAGDRFPLDDGK